MPALSGVSLGGGRGSTAGLSASITGGDTVQNGLATVACEVVVTDPTGAETYAWTLTDPRGVSRTALFDDATIADPVFTPDLTVGGGQWVARVTVTRGSSSLVLSKIVTIGQSGFVLARSIVSDEATDASVSGGNIVWGGVTFAAPNTGPSVVDGDLVFANAAGSTQFSTGVRTPPLVTVLLTNLCGISEVGTRQVLIILDVESYVPAAANEALRVGVENATNPVGTGGSSRGVMGGQAFSTAIRVGDILYQDTSGIGQQLATATVASIAGIACLFSGTTVDVYSSTSAFTDAAAVLAATVKQNGGMRPGTVVAALNQVIISAAKPTAGAGATCTIRGLQVWVR